jgi:hypothetical protein
MQKNDNTKKAEKGNRNKKENRKITKGQPQPAYQQ